MSSHSGEASASCYTPLYFTLLLVLNLLAVVRLCNRVVFVFFAENVNGNNNTEAYSSPGVVTSTTGRDFDGSSDPNRCWQSTRPEVLWAGADPLLLGCSSDRPRDLFAVLPLLSLENGSTLRSLPNALEQPSVTLPRHVSFSDGPPECFEYSNDSDSNEDETCLHGHNIVTQPQQSDNSYQLLPSVRVPLPQPTAADIGNRL